MSNTQKLSMSRFIFQYLIPLFTAALLLVLLSYFSDIRSGAAQSEIDAGIAAQVTHVEADLPPEIA